MESLGVQRIFLAEEEVRFAAAVRGSEALVGCMEEPTRGLSNIALKTDRSPYGKGPECGSKRAQIVDVPVGTFS